MTEAPVTARKQARDSQRWRLIEAMSTLVGRQGYADTSIAQVIKQAGVSRKTFYEYFDTKEACFLSAYDELSDRFIRSLVREGATAKPSAERAMAQLKLYLKVLESDPAIARAFIVEVLAAGPNALERREAVNQRFGELVFAHVAKDPIILRAILGGINNVVAQELLGNRGASLSKLYPSLARFVRQASGS